VSDTAGGDAAKDEGMGRAARGRRMKMARLQRDLLDALLKSGQPLTVEAATPADQIARQYADGGKWVGPAVAELAGDGIVSHLRDTKGRLAVLRSPRPARHSGTSYVWQLVDPTAARARRDQLHVLLTRLPKAPEQRGLFDGVDT
jgi:hypothetical protein